MDTYLLSLGWWNFAGSILMIGFFYQSFGKKMLNDWTKIFNTEFVLDYWGKFWLTWSIGLGIFFGLVNIYAAKLNYVEVKEFLIWFDVVAYIFLMGLSLSQLKRNEPVREFMRRCWFLLFGFYGAFGRCGTRKQLMQFYFYERNTRVVADWASSVTGLRVSIR